MTSSSFCTGSASFNCNSAVIVGKKTGRIFYYPTGYDSSQAGSDLCAYLQPDNASPVRLVFRGELATHAQAVLESGWRFRVKGQFYLRSVPGARGTLEMVVDKIECLQ